MADIYLAIGDRLPIVERQLLGPEGNPPNLTGATVRFVVRNRNGVEVIDRPAQIADPLTALVRYAWHQDDVGVLAKGGYEQRWRALFPGDGAQELRASYPNDRWNTLYVGD